MALPRDADYTEEQQRASAILGRQALTGEMPIEPMSSLEHVLRHKVWVAGKHPAARNSSRER